METRADDSGDESQPALPPPRPPAVLRPADYKRSVSRGRLSATLIDGIPRETWAGDRRRMLASRLVLGVLVVGLLSRVAAENVQTTTTTTKRTSTVLTNEREARNLKSKLSTAEEQVRSLLRKMDTVNEDATRAKAEIHDTLREAWHLVDLLSQSSEVIETMRVKLTIAEERASSLEDQIKERDRVVDACRADATSTKLQISTLTKQRDEAATNCVCKDTEEELVRTREKLQWSNSLFNQSMIYGRLAGSYDVMRQVMVQKYEMLDKIYGVMSDWRSEYERIDLQISDMDSVLREADRHHQLLTASLRMDTDEVAGIQQKVFRLEGKLKDAEASRDAAQSRADSLQSSLNRCSKSSDSTVTSFLSGAGGRHEKVNYVSGERADTYYQPQQSNSSSLLLFLLLLVFSLLLGLIVVMCSGILRNGVSPGAGPATTQSPGMNGTPRNAGGSGGTPGSRNQSPFVRYTPNSPMNYGSAGTSPGTGR